MRFIVMAMMGLLFTGTRCVIAQDFKDFTLEAVSLKTSDDVAANFEWKEHKGKTVVLHFLLKTECPYCLKYTNQYAQLAVKTPEVVHLFIKPDSVRDIQSWMKQVVKVEGVKQPTIYRDPDAKLARRFGIPDGYLFHGQSMHYPALIALDGNGKELFRYVGKNNSDRMPKEDFIKKLDSNVRK